MSVYQMKDGRWVVSYRLPGDRTTKKKYFGRGTDGRQKAMAFDLELSQAKKQGDENAAKVAAEARKPKVTELTFFQLSQKYLEQKILSPKTFQTITYTLNVHVLPVFGNKPISKLNMADLAAVDERLIKPRNKITASSTGKQVIQKVPPLSVSSRNRVKAYCRAICQWGEDNCLVGGNPFAKFKADRKKEGKAPDLITNDELRAMWKAAAPHLWWAMRCIMYLGVRPGPTELLSIKMSDIDLEGGGVWVVRTKTLSKRELQKCAEEFLADLKELMEKEPNRQWLVEYEGKKVGSLNTAWRHMLRRAGIERRIRPYDLRHWYATQIITSGADIKSASVMMGHSSPNLTLQTYAHLVEGQKRKVANMVKLPDGVGKE